MPVKIKKSISIGPGEPLLFICGPCVIESESLCLTIAKKLRAVADKNGLNMVFKASFDKANRSSISSFRGPGLERGLKILKKVKDVTDLPILTDIHEPAQAKKVAKVADILQIPAFLCRQTDLLLAAAATGRPVNVKKGQFLAPGDVKNIREKIFSRRNRKLIVTERGTSFGYSNLVVDMKGLPAMRALGVPVIFDATHSVQQPGGGGRVTGGDARMAAPLARAAAGAGVDGFFFEVHPTPKRAKSDAANCLPLNSFEGLARTLVVIDALVRHAR